MENKAATKYYPMALEAMHKFQLAGQLAGDNREYFQSSFLGILCANVSPEVWHLDVDKAEERTREFAEALEREKARTASAATCEAAEFQPNDPTGQNAAAHLA